MKIAVIGLGHVELSNATLLTQHNEVVAIDLDLFRQDLPSEQLRAETRS